VAKTLTVKHCKREEVLRILGPLPLFSLTGGTLDRGGPRKDLGGRVDVGVTEGRLSPHFSHGVLVTDS